ncbi:putative RNA helicase [Helianthus annuus]|nr:putative RNA helicase [Helianthus annuus]
MHYFWGINLFFLLCGGCPHDAASYIHRVGRTGRYDCVGQSVLFLLHTEMKMLERLQKKKIPVQFDKTVDGRVVKVNEVQPRGGRTNFGRDNFRRNNNIDMDFDG